MNGLAKVSTFTFVWKQQVRPDPAKGHTYGWKRPDLATQFIRFAALNDWPLVTIEQLRGVEHHRRAARRGTNRSRFLDVIKGRQGPAGRACRGSVSREFTGTA